MRDANSIQWKRLSVEAMAIVAGILLAFAIDAWWDEREMRKEEAEILLGLQKEFVLTREILGRRIAGHQNALLLLGNTLDALYGDSWNADELDFDEVLFELVAPNTTDIGGGVLDGLIGSGRIELLSSRSLREMLAGWEGVFGEVRDDEMNNSALVFDRVLPYLLRWKVSVSGAFRQRGIDWPDGAKSTSVDADAFSRLLSDPEFRVLVEIRYGYLSHTTGEFEKAIAAVDEILEEIDRSIMQ